MSDQQRRNVLAVEVDDGVVLPGMSNALGFGAGSTINARPAQKDKQGAVTDHGIRLSLSHWGVLVEYARKDGAGKWVKCSELVRVKRASLEPLSSEQ